MSKKVKEIFPERFREIYQNKTGFDPVQRYNRSRLAILAACGLGFVAAMAVFVTLLQPAKAVSTASQKTDSVEVLIFFGLLVGALIAFRFAGDSVNEAGVYFDKVRTLASVVGCTTDELGAFTSEAIQVLAVGQLLDLGRCVLAIEQVVGAGSGGSKPHPAKETVKQILRHRYEVYTFWGIVPDTGWQSYFPN